MEHGKASGFLSIEMNGMNPSDPIEGVKVTIADSKNPNKILKTVVTDSNGQVPDVELPVSLTRNEEQAPSSKYDLTIEVPIRDQSSRAEYTYIKRGVEVFAGQTTNNHDEFGYILSLKNMTTGQRADFEFILPDSHLAANETMVYQNPDQFSHPPSTHHSHHHGHHYHMASQNRPFVPSYISIYLGSVELYEPYIPVNGKYIVRDTYKQYLKRVCAIEFGGIPNLAEQAIYANVLAVNSFALNRIYTEVYRDKGYGFDITSKKKYDQFYPAGGVTNQKVDEVIDKVFDQYIKKRTKIQPYFSQYCANAPCKDIPKGLGQLLSNRMALQGKSYIEILKHFYGDDISIVKATVVKNQPKSYTGELRKGMSGPNIVALKKFLNLIRQSYNAIPKLEETPLFDELTEKAVKKFQEINKKRLKVVNGIVNEPTWRLIGEKFYFLGGDF